MSTIKLYIEEQVKEAYNEGFYDGFEIGDRDVERTINSLTPIELPSDEEIENIAEKTLYVSMNGFIAGANWMKEQILNKVYNSQKK